MVISALTNNKKLSKNPIPIVNSYYHYNNSVKNPSIANKPYENKKLIVSNSNNKVAIKEKNIKKVFISPQVKSQQKQKIYQNLGIFLTYYLDTLTIYSGDIDLENYKEFYYFPSKVHAKHHQPDFIPKLDLHEAQVRLHIT